MSRVLGVAAVVAVAVAAVGYGVQAIPARRTTDGMPGPGPVTVVLDIHHSRFAPDRLQVAQGTLVRFVVRNADPIAHELVVGDDEVHRRHAGGTEAEHAAVPGEVSVRAGDVGETSYLFDEPGTVTFACHLPGHLEYGMVGEVEVR